MGNINASKRAQHASMGLCDKKMPPTVRPDTNILQSVIETMVTSRAHRQDQGRFRRPGSWRRENPLDPALRRRQSRRRRRCLPRLDLRDLYAESEQTLQYSFLAVSMPNFASKYSLELGKLSPRSTQCTALHRSQCSKFSSKIAENFC